jgi:hypothetical protein
MAVRLRRRFCGGLLFDVLHHMDQHLGRARISAGGFVDQRLALGNLAARSVRRDEHRLVQCGDQKPRKVLLGPTAGSWRDRCSRSAGHSGHPPAPQGSGGVDRQLAKAEFHPYMRVAVIANITIRVFTTTIFESDEATPRFPPLLAP